MYRRFSYSEVFRYVKKRIPELKLSFIEAALCEYGISPFDGPYEPAVVYQCARSIEQQLIQQGSI